MKPIIAIFLAFGVQANLYSQNLVYVTVGGSYAFTNTSNVISTNFGGTGQGIGWSGMAVDGNTVFAPYSKSQILTSVMV